MRISTKGQYAIKLMLDLAIYYNGEPVKIKDIARRQDISDKYLEQIVSILHKASLVRSSRGAKGGYRLAAAPEDYTIGMILRATEGELVPVDCAQINGEDCKNSDKCVTVRIWKRLNDAVNGVLDDIKLSDLVEWQNELIDQYVI
ncbi:MAG: Rrf2 family transcriptional regulator [Lachnospiraceae bacterium]|nr:Rrf2 family transcriptional regulator [Lachnospiraceae bacterium]